MLRKLFLFCNCFNILQFLVSGMNVNVTNNNTINADRNELIVLTDLNFETKFNSKKDWFIKFYAPWCRHCKALLPVFDKLVLNYPDINFGVMNSDKNPSITKMYNISSFPTIMYKIDGVIDRYSGARTYDGFSNFLDRILTIPYLTLENNDQLYQLDTYGKFSDNVTFVLSYNSLINDINYIKNKDFILDIFKNVTYILKQHCSFAILDSMTEESMSIFKYEPSRTSLKMIVKDWNQVTQQDMINFVERNNYPLINKFDNHNFKRLSDIQNKIIIMLVIENRNQMYADNHLEIFKHTIASLSTKDLDGYIFGYLDGIRFRSFIQMFHTLIPSILLIDHTLELHYNYPLSTLILNTPTTTSTTSNNNIEDNHMNTNQISSIILSIIHHPMGIQWKPNYELTLLRKITYKLIEYSPYSWLIILLPILCFIISYWTPYPKEKKIKKD